MSWPSAGHRPVLHRIECPDWPLALGIRPRSPYAAEPADVAAFLTRLAVEQRAMPSTQKQALNAIVFLLKRALNREIGPTRT
jgi:hypothetical protein